MNKSLLLGAAVLLTATPALACEDISSQVVKLTACVDEAWAASAGEGAQEFVYVDSSGGEMGLMVITENGNMPASALRAGILSNAATGLGLQPDQVAVVGERIENVGGKPWNVIEYDVPYNGGTYRFQNFYYSQPGYGLTQVLTYSSTAESDIAAYRAGVFLASVQIGG